MDLSLSHEQKLLVQTVRDFIAEELAPLEAEVEENGALAQEKADTIFAKSRDLGLYAMNIPEEFGGGGLSAFDTMLVEEQFGRTTDILVRRAFGNVYEVLLACQGEQIERWLTPTVRGGRVCSIAITEPGAGSDAASIRTKAVENGQGGWKLSGSKHFISDGFVSDFFVVSAVTDPDKGAKGISLFLVDKGAPGLTIGRDQPMMGLRGTSHVELSFDEVPLKPIHMLGERGMGFRMALGVLGRVRLAQVGARSIGKATKVLDLMIDYARERKQFGHAIGEFQLVAQMLADSAMEINAARLALWQTAVEIDEGKDPRTRISLVKVQAAETLGRVVDRAVQVFGGMGFCKDLPIERYYRDARIYRIFDGTSEIHRTVMGRSLMKGEPGLYDPFA
ncbi:acyl-CoA dehydrogenase/acyl-CoA dehydrogenase [Rhodobacter aestuarii]|uniref:Acyl-CoA dehydrogenase/acyl-CoA dehydrogenase n=1 Tax=Rhodobacter aestuarii TaxID=453582 RepID=A0A1N7PL44_9RHOB|nr:acyl-CoA dehydrogenase family protein [Rhodobacter aestuarii]PTV94347.1 acyl-CoA dehydrogenase/acyl-CoA dehydrogenase [Rhodobacter aestuarii]SIT11089.1 acyl-CoA dehydrogenase/acyl-CoA dehydrogenase [Rhodobacter aestuarii]